MKSRTSEIVVRQVITPAELEQAYAIRRRVFIEEQRVPEEIELDADDARALHALALAGAEPVGCGRMLQHGMQAKIGRMAVLSDWRRRGVGGAILEFLIAAAHARGCGEAVLHAQLQAEKFYLGHDFAPVGEVFEEAGIAHRRMTRAI